MSRRPGFVVSGADSVLRRCALTLHALEGEDRAWMIENLPASQRSLLEGLVAELQALGMPRDPAAVKGALHNRAARAEPEGASAESSESTGNTSTMQVLGAARGCDMAVVLQHEPIGVIATLAKLVGQSAGDAILVHLKADQRRAIQDHLIPSTLRPHSELQAPMMRQALLEELSSRLSRQQRAIPVDAARPSGWRKHWHSLMGNVR